MVRCVVTRLAETLKVAFQHAVSKTSAIWPCQLYDVMFMNVIKCGYYAWAVLISLSTPGENFGEISQNFHVY